MISTYSYAIHHIRKKKMVMHLFKGIIINPRNTDEINSIFHTPIPPSLQWIFNPDNSICLVGNGHIHTACGKAIDSHDVVVRFNTQLINVPYTGKKTSVLCTFKEECFVRNNKDILNILMNTKIPSYNYQTAFHTDRSAHVVALIPSVIEAIRKIGDNPTRGFLAILLFSRFFRRMSIVGFGGPPEHRKHHSEPVHTLRVEHALFGEHFLIRNELERELGIQLKYLDTIRP